MNLLRVARTAFLAMGLAIPAHFANSNQDTPIAENIQYSLQDLHCLTKNIYHEARGESFKGKLAVAQVTMNRVNHSRWPGTICEVVYQKIKGIPQFSWTTMRGLRVVDQDAWQEAKTIAFGVLTGDLILKNFNYHFFHNKSVQFAQNRKGSRTIGNHIFY